LRSFFIAGFECSSLKRPDGVRLDLLRSTAHDRHVREDYAEIRRHGICTARDGLRWHLIEARRDWYDWRTWLPMVRAARIAGVQVIWDLCHYGWPDHIDIWGSDFVESFAHYSRAAAQLLRNESDEIPFYCPINEMSYWAWAGGDVGKMAPACVGRGDELKRQLVRAYAASVAAIREVDPRARFIVAEPLIHVISGDDGVESALAANRHRQAQFEVHEMLVGSLAPELGGHRQLLDIVGVNFYPDNQWYINGSTIPLGHHAYRPLHHLLQEVHRRFGRPLLVAETGAEGSARPYWLHHVGAEVSGAMGAGIPVVGICLYPILDYPGWENDRLCEVGLFSMPNHTGKRFPNMAYAGELVRQSNLFDTARRRSLPMARRMSR